MTELDAKNRFFAKLFLFLACFAAVAALVPALSSLRIRTYSYALPPDKKILFVGDSHIAQGVDDTEIPGAFNSSVSADTYVSAYLRLRLLLRDNPQIETVFLGVSPYSISRGSDETIFRPSLVAMKVPYYLPHFGKDEWTLYLSRAPKDFLRAIFLSPSTYLRSSKLTNKKYFKKLGAFNPRERCSLAKAIAATETLEKPLFWGCEAELNYLGKIRALCESRDVRLIFLNTPIFRAEKYLDVAHYYTTLRERFAEIDLWDYMNLAVPDDCREDVNHLNAFGAKRFAKLLAARIAATDETRQAISGKESRVQRSVKREPSARENSNANVPAGTSEMRRSKREPASRESRFFKAKNAGRGRGFSGSASSTSPNPRCTRRHQYTRETCPLATASSR